MIGSRHRALAFGALFVLRHLFIHYLPFRRQAQSILSTHGFLVGGA